MNSLLIFFSLLSLTLSQGLQQLTRKTNQLDLKTMTAAKRIVQLSDQLLDTAINQYQLIKREADSLSAEAVFGSEMVLTPQERQLAMGAKQRAVQNAINLKRLIAHAELMNKNLHRISEEMLRSVGRDTTKQMMQISNLQGPPFGRK